MIQQRECDAWTVAFSCLCCCASHGRRSEVFVVSMAAGNGATGLIHIVPRFAAAPDAPGVRARIILVSQLFLTLYLGAVIAAGLNRPAR